MATKLTCSCGRTLSVPDKYAGKTVSCLCGTKCRVPAPDDIQVAPLEEAQPEPAPGRGARHRARRARKGFRTRKCPGCKAPLPAAAILCPLCGFDLRTGPTLLDEDPEGFSWGSVAGPAAAVVVAIAAVVIWKTGILRKATPVLAPWSDPEKKKAEDPREKKKEQARNYEEHHTNRPIAPARFDGGAVEGRLELSDASTPYEIRRDIVVAGGGYIRINEGVSLVGPPEVAFRVRAGGKVTIVGSEEQPVVIAMPYVLSGEGSETIASDVLFAGEVSLIGPRHAEFRAATFLRGLSLSSMEGQGKAIWQFTRCEVHPAGGVGGVCLDVHLTDARSQVEASITVSNVLGTVSGEVGAGNVLHLTRNYWTVPFEAATRGIAPGRAVRLEPFDPLVVEGAGADGKVTIRQLLVRAGVVGEEELAGVLASARLGFEVGLPEGWRPTGDTSAAAPEKYPRARIQIERRGGERLLVRLRLALVEELRRMGTKQLVATEGEVVMLDDDREALAFSVMFAADEETWGRQYVMIRSGENTFVLTLSARAQDFKALSGVVTDMARDIRIVGEKPKSPARRPSRALR